MAEQASIEGEAEVFVEEDVRGTGDDPDIGEAEYRVEEDVGERNLISVDIKRSLFTYCIVLSHYHCSSMTWETLNLSPEVFATRLVHNLPYQQVEG